MSVNYPVAVVLLSRPMPGRQITASYRKKIQGNF